MSQIIKNSSGASGAVNSVTGTNGVTASPTTGNVVVSGVNATTSSVGVSSFINTDFTVNGSGQAALLRPYRIYKSNTVNLLSATTQLLFTTPSNKFLICQMAFVSSSITGWVSGANFNLGFIAPNYNQIQNGVGDTFEGIFSSGSYFITYADALAPSSSEIQIVPGLTNVYINVTAAAVATTYNINIYFLGFEIF